MIFHTDLASCHLTLAANLPQVGYLSNLLVAHWARGEGHGSALMVTVCDLADLLGLTLVLDCAERLVGWYETFGFVRGEVEGGSWADMTCMVRPTFALTGSRGSDKVGA